MSNLKCRICDTAEMTEVLSLGEQYLTGVFPKTKDEEITKGELGLTWCESCGLLQLSNSFDLDEMYGENYGYRSGLNNSMVKHLQKKVAYISEMVDLNSDDLVIDIGSNDATTLKSYTGDFTKVGIDPTGSKFKEYYTDDIHLIADFFNGATFKANFPDRKAKVITSIAMFYDLENPTQFVKDIESCLTNDGIWHFEQSYMPSMLRTNSYDTICHEHLEFYSLTVVNDLLENCGLKILDVEMNDINGGSFAVTACKKSSPLVSKSNDAVINWLLNKELELKTSLPYDAFKTNVEKHKIELVELLTALAKAGKKVFGYGASTKGNVLLQYCGITPELLPYIAEVNEDKFGSFTPGTLIPIISEKEAKELKPDYYLVLPWHFKNNILQRETEFRLQGGKFIFPLPFIEIV